MSIRQPQPHAWTQKSTPIFAPGPQGKAAIESPSTTTLHHISKAAHRGYWTQTSHIASQSVFQVLPDTNAARKVQVEYAGKIIGMDGLSPVNPKRKKGREQKGNAKKNKTKTKKTKTKNKKREPTTRRTCNRCAHAKRGTPGTPAMIRRPSPYTRGIELPYFAPFLLLDVKNPQRTGKSGR